MKQYFIIFAFVIGFTSLAVGQNTISRTPIGKRQNKFSKDDDSSQLDSLGYNVDSIIKAWKLRDLNSSKLLVSLDTILGEQQNYNPIYKTSLSNSYLGNLGSAYQSNIYIDRVKDESFLFFKPYRTYMIKPEDIVYFNTTTPYTRLSYETGGPKGQSENLLRVLQTQNISPNWNFGINYDLISSDGQYQNQKTKLYDFTLFSSYKKREYSVDVVMNMNRMFSEENGGVYNDSLITDINEEPENIQVNLSDASSKLTNFNFFMNHSYGIGKETEKIVEEDTTYTYAINLLYSLNYENNSWKYKDDDLSSDYYDTSYLDQSATFDKVEQSTVKNSFQVVFNENENKWIRLGARFGIVSEFTKYNLRRNVSQYAWQQKDENIHSNEILASLFSMSGKSLNWKASGNYVFEGYKQNDFKLNYDLTKWLGEKNQGHGFSIFGKLESRTADFMLKEYYGNHQKWNTDFDKITELQVGFEYFNEKYKFKIGARLNQIDNYTYFGLEALPQQSNSGLTIVTGYVEKNFKLGNFHLNQKLVGQNSSNDDILPLPSLSVYSNNYYKNEFFKGALGFQTGVSVHYNTAFYAPDYMPSTGQFFLQDQKELGNYPKIDVYVNFRIKRTRLFIMYEHLNSSFGDKNYFTTYHYPINPGMLKYGLIWTFYN
ncbi:putative porin [Marinifilum sp. RC60d5]|uniref:putative porin n=1 Tax=Marinifilum sp. RC60d5 TaxID=3458414 RepID=UPI0040353AB1